MTLPEGHDAQSVLEKVDRVASVLGMPEKRQQLQDSLAAEMAGVAERARVVKTPGKVLFILPLQDGCIVAVRMTTGVMAWPVMRPCRSRRSLRHRRVAPGRWS